MFIDAYPLQPVNVLELLFIFFALFSISVLKAQRAFHSLCVLLALEAILMSFNFLEELRLVSHLSTPALMLAVGPALLWFVKGLVYPDRVLGWSDYAHFIPVLLAWPFTDAVQWVVALGSISMLLYLAITYQLLKRYDRALLDMSSFSGELQLQWLQKMLVFMAAFVIVDAFRISLQPYVSYAVRNNWYFATHVVGFLIYVFLVRKAMLQPEVFSGLQKHEEMLADVPKKDDVEEHYRAVASAIETHVNDEKLYLQPRLTLTDLSTSMGLNIKAVSGAINQCMGCNFNDYINGLRVEYVKGQLSHRDKTINLLEAGLSAGFNSKSSFNTTFKKFTGQTPSQYIKSLNGV